MPPKGAVIIVNLSHISNPIYREREKKGKMDRFEAVKLNKSSKMGVSKEKRFVITKQWRSLLHPPDDK